MDPHLPFLKAIAANPPDDLPRMVYADFLEETGEPVHVARAHFIRTQIALESLTPRTKEYRETKALEQRLKEMFLDTWLFDLPEYLRSCGRVMWRRGFPDRVEMAVGELAIHGDELFHWFPITRLNVQPSTGVIVVGRGFFHRFPALRNICELSFNPRTWGIADEDPGEESLFMSLMTAPVFPSLRTLGFAGMNGITDAWLVRFVSRFSTTSFALTLEELDLSNCFTITDAGANTLAAARSLDRLKVLRLVGVPLSVNSVAMLRRRFGDGLVV